MVNHIKNWIQNNNIIIIITREYDTPDSTKQKSSHLIILRMFGGWALETTEHPRKINAIDKSCEIMTKLSQSADSEK